MKTLSQPRAVDPRTLYLDEAEAFAARRAGALPFRYLRLLTGCGERELGFLVKKIYCDSLPECVPGSTSVARSVLRSLAHPFYYLVAKKWLWRRAPRADFDFETIDRPYFEKWFSDAFARLRGTKRLTPRHRGDFGGIETTAPVADVVSLRTVALLFLAPLWLPSLLWMAPGDRAAFVDAYRKALSFYAIFEGHFNRYPCRDFFTFSDDTNHPSRYLAFRRHCGGRLVVIQNGERSQHPMHAFGMLDVYLTFGEFGRRLFPELRMFVPKTVPVGALCLNERYPLAQKLSREARAPSFDILFIDQSLWPHNGVDRKTGESFFKMFRNLDRLKASRPALRMAYQLRPYWDRTAEKRAVLDEVKRRIPHGIEILENENKGESYTNISHSRLVITFSSTLGIEAFYFGRGTRTLFFNYAGNPYDVYAPEPLYQLTDESGDYAAFERKVDELLNLELSSVPDSVRDRHYAFDGRVQERIAAELNQEPTPS